MIVNGYDIKPGADLSGANLRGINLSGADIRWSNLSGADMQRSSLSGADMRWSSLSGADMRWALLSRVNLSWSNLSGADMRWADLSRANLRGINLSGADIRWSNLSEADMHWSNLSGADMRWSHLSRANLTDAKGLHLFRITPDGAFLAYKKLATGEVAIVNVPMEARRVNTYGSRKIRVSMLRVEQIIGKSHGGQRTGTKYPGLIYEPGAVLTCDDFDPDPRIECSRGLYVFLTRQEAEEW